MWDQEKEHLKAFDELISQVQVRPTALRPLWNLFGFSLGVGSALMGPKGAMMCTEAVETVVGEHYNDQMRQLANIKGMEQLSDLFKKFRDEELEHLDAALNNESQKVYWH